MALGSSATDLQLAPFAAFCGRPGPLLIVVADGVGIAPDGPSNAVTEAETPTLDRLFRSPLFCELLAHGTAVGLPSDDDMGNSEVGHNALGAGRIFAQGAALVNDALASGSAYTSDVWKQLIVHARRHTLHLLGLHSDGNVHSHVDHLYALMRQAATEGVKRMRVHVLLDGRDTPERSALGYIDRTENELQALNDEFGTDARIASGGGRMRITMDRYGADWAMVERGWDTHVLGEGRHFSSATEAVETLYEESDDGDQYLEPFVIVDDADQAVGPIRDGDAVLLFNFRGDRAIEISQAFEDDNFARFRRRDRPDVYFAGMLEYDGDAKIPTNYLVAPPEIDETMGEYLVAAGVRSFAVSETQKFGHVTYFWNGNRSGYLDAALETYVEIPSDNVEFNKTPGMKLPEITDETIDLLRSREFRFGRINYPNGDMVGHTGDLTATIEAMRILDRELERLVAAIEELDGILIFTADHGNADIMYTETDGVRSPKTSHTLSKVPFAIFDPNYDGEYVMDPPEDAGLSNVASTAFALLGYTPPETYRRGLIRFVG